MVERGWGRRDLMRGSNFFFEGERLKGERSEDFRDGARLGIGVPRYRSRGRLQVCVVNESDKLS